MVYYGKSSKGRAGKIAGRVRPAGVKRAKLDALYDMFERGVRDETLPGDLALEHDHCAYGTAKRARQTTRSVSAKKATSRRNGGRGKKS